MTPEELARKVLGILRYEDLEILLNLNFRRAYSRGELLTAEGETVDRFFLLEEGSMRLSREGEEPRYLRPGQIIGSTSTFIQPRPSEHNVYAAEDLIALSMSADELEWLQQAEPQVACRVMQAIAAALAARSYAEPVGAAAQPEPPPLHEENSSLSRFIRACEETRDALAAMGDAPEDGAAYWANERIPAVSTVYRPILRALAGLLDGAAPQDRDRLVEQARLHLMELAGGSRLVERMHTRPTGRAAGYRGFNHIYRNVPEGDDTIGLLTDAWLLTRPFAEAIRERRTRASHRVTREVLDHARPDRVYRILSLGCGPARSLADILEEPGLAEKISVMCVDDDQEALVHANNLLKGRAPRADITFRQASPASLTPDAEGFGGYDLVATLYTADNSDLPTLGRILFTSHRWLHAGGVIELVVFGDAVPDWLLLEVLLDWRPHRFTIKDLEEVLARSPFGSEGGEVTASPSGLNIFLRARK